MGMTERTQPGGTAAGEDHPRSVSDRRPPATSLILYPLFFVSGAAGLGYQAVWLRMLTGGVGHEAPAMLGVASAFLAGLGLGAWMLGKRVRSSSSPLGWYG